MDTDILHQRGDAAEWNESFYFNLYDRKNDVCAFMRIGLKPNKNEKSMFCFLMLPDGRIAGMRAAGPVTDDSLKIGGLSFEKAEAEKRWKMRYSGFMQDMADRQPMPVDFDLEFRALNRVFDYRECVSGEKELIARKVASEHLEQFGRAQGSLTLGDKVIQIDGLGERDHSWGIREWTAPKMWIWLTAEFSDRCALNVTKLVMDQGEVDAGFVHLDGENRPIVRAKVTTAAGPDGRPKGLSMILTDQSGREYRVEADVVRTAMLPFEGPGQSAAMFETLACYRFDGQIGYGIAEYLIRKG